MGKIFIGARHSYELVISNVGLIDAIFSVQPPGGAFSKCFSFEPDDGLLIPRGYQAIRVEFFCPTLLGDFDEYCAVLFDGCLQPERVRFRGTVVGPTYYFDPPLLDFGNISFGFSSEKSIKLKNTSLVPINFTIRIIAPKSEADELSEVPKPDLSQLILQTTATEPDSQLSLPGTESETWSTGTDDVDEFTIQPSSGSLNAMSQVELSVRCTPKHLGMHTYTIAVDIVGVGMGDITLPVKVASICPIVCIDPAQVNLRRCFLRHPYPIEFTLTNQSTQPARYEMLTQQMEEPNGTPERAGLHYSSPQSKGEIPPSGTCTLPVIFKAEKLGDLETAVPIVICGLKDRVMHVPVSCIGEGPVLYVEPTDLHWGTIPVLQSTPKVVKLTNESAIAASFEAKMINTESIFRAEPKAGVIPALGQLDLIVLAEPDDVCAFKDQMEIVVADAVSKRLIELTAIGQGSTIVTDPPLLATLRLGPHFSMTPLRTTFKLASKGRRQQQLIWSIEGQTARRPSQLTIKPSDEDSRWIITPYRFNINPGESMEVTLEVTCDKPQVVKRRIFCHTIIGRKGAKTLIKTVDISVNFVAPNIEFSHQELVFRVIKKPQDVLEPQTQSFTMKNNSGLELSGCLGVTHPFHLITDGSRSFSQELRLQPNESSEFHVLFDPAYEDSLHSRRVDELLFITYSEHPNRDVIRLVGEVHFPNIKFDSNAVHFGYILNHTEITKHLLMTNTSPLPVTFRWSFLVGERANIVFRRQARLPDSPLATTQRDCESISDTERANAKLGNEVEDGDEIQWENRQTQEKPITEAESPSVSDGLEEVSKQNESILPDEMKVSKDNKILAVEQESAPVETYAMNDPTDILAEKNEVLNCLIEQDNDVVPLGIEEIFDITPLYGELAAGETQSMSFVFYGHADIEASITAMCEVEGGPTYTMEISGGASYVDYYLDRTEIDFDPVRFDKPAVSELLLANTGQVEFEFSITPSDLSTEIKETVVEESLYSAFETGQLVAEPAVGYLAAGETCTIRLSYLARKPGFYEKSVQLYVAHFPPKLIILRGLADFARLNLDLPRYYAHKKCFKVPMQTAVENSFSEVTGQCREQSGPFGSDTFERIMNDLLKELHKQVIRLLQNAQDERPSDVICTCRGIKNQSAATEIMKSKNGRVDLDPVFLHDRTCVVAKAVQSALHRPLSNQCTIPDWILERVPDIGLQMEAERCHVCSLLEQRALEYASRVNTNKNIADASLATASDKSVMATTIGPKQTKGITAGNKLRLPGYVLDFGVVIFGTVTKRPVRSINTGFEPVSFRFEPQSVQRIAQCGFAPSISRIRKLPGAPDHEWADWEITFDPKGAGLSSGLVGVELIINILNGPLIPVWLQAEVVTPALSAHVNCLEFGAVQRGEARLLPVQLYNPSPVCVNWVHARYDKTVGHSTGNQPTCIGRRIGTKTLRFRTDSHPPPVFEVIPKSGILGSGEKRNIQIKFCPMEQRHHEERVIIQLTDSTERLQILCRGDGLEPQLEFDQGLIQFNPCLPFSDGEEKVITVSNPCEFPIEFYATELDQCSYEEDQILRKLGSFDEFGLMYLPPRKPGESLPPELTSFYEEYLKRLQESKDPSENVEATMKDDILSRCEVKSSNPELTCSATPTDNDGRSTPTEILVATFNNDASRMSEESRMSASVVAKDVTPISLALARHLGITVNPDGQLFASRRGIFIIVHGPLAVVRQPVIRDLSKRYQATVLSVDQIVLEALATSSTDAAERARQCCLQSGYEMVPNMVAKDLLERIVEADAKDERIEYSGEPSGQTSPLPLGPPIPRRISLTGIMPTGAPVISFAHPITEESEEQKPLMESLRNTMFSTILPDDVVVSLIEERICYGDCHKGVILDGLDSQFVENRQKVAQLVLKALHDRLYIYCVTVKAEYSSLKYLEEQMEATQVANKMADEAIRQQRVEEISEFEYSLLSEQERAQLDELRTRIRRQKRQAELELKRIRGEQEREEHEAENRRIKYERESISKKKGKKGEDKLTQPVPSAKDGIERPGGVPTRMTHQGAKSMRNDHLESSLPEKQHLLSVDRRRISKISDKRRKSGGDSLKDEAIREQTNEPEMTEEERLLYQR
ncbi:hypothetical protein P879_04214 [Paragonimus westermani]|uniref:Hydrocephalus-inducing protein n=1 Tax=Paragonimus westermani TaxID=34504 RepID=A0A8T0D9Y4_9TREM|nr:hypothetical protein P879_04214 [Paragonimus westermani]